MYKWCIRDEREGRVWVSFIMADNVMAAIREWGKDNDGLYSRIFSIERV